MTHTYRMRWYPAAIAILIELLSGCEQHDWHKAEQTGTVSGYEDFVLRHPTSSLAKEAGERITQLEWQKAQSVDTVVAYKNFLKKYPASARAQDARALIEFREAAQDLREIDQRILEYLDYVDQKTDGSSAALAKLCGRVARGAGTSTSHPSPPSSGLVVTLQMTTYKASVCDGKIEVDGSVTNGSRSASLKINDGAQFELVNGHQYAYSGGSWRRQ